MDIDLDGMEYTLLKESLRTAQAAEVDIVTMLKATGRDTRERYKCRTAVEKIVYIEKLIDKFEEEVE